MESRTPLTEREVADELLQMRVPRDNATAGAAQGEAQARGADLCEDKRGGEDSDDSEGECNYRTNASSIDPCNELARDEGRRQT